VRKESGPQPARWPVAGWLPTYRWSELWIARPRAVPREFIETSRFGAKLGGERLFETVEDADTAFRKRREQEVR
jgi:hypothetical protein